MTEAAKRCVEALRDNINNGFLLVGGFNGSVHASEIIHLIESLSAQLEAAQPKWISVKERMPDFFDTVIIIDDRKVAFPAHYAEKGGLKGFYSIDGYFYTYITHWMPLPEPPKEDVYGKNNA